MHVKDLTAWDIDVLYFDSDISETEQNFGDTGHHTVLRMTVYQMCITCGDEPLCFEIYDVCHNF